MPSVKLFLFSICFLTIHLGIAQGQSSYTPIKQINCTEKPNEFYHFYDGENIPFKYEKIGEVYACEEGNMISNHDILSTLKYLAWSNCANGLLFIKSGHIGDEGRKFYSALAVRIQTDSDFKQQNGSESDTSFIKYVEQKQQQYQSQKRLGMGLTVIGLAILVLILIGFQNG